METLRMLATLLPLLVSSGINLYATVLVDTTVLVAGLAIQFRWIEGTPAGLDVLGGRVVGLMRLGDATQF